MKTKSFKITAKDGVDIRAEFTHDETRTTKGVIVIIHGFGEYLAAYRELALVLVEAGYASVVFDQRGHGDLQPREKLEKLQGIVPAYQTLLDDIDIVVAEAKRLVPDVPIAIYGHSMGGNIVINYLIRPGKEKMTDRNFQMFNQSDFACVALESPWFGLYNEISPMQAFVTKILGCISPRLVVSKGLSSEENASEEDNACDNDDDIFYHNRISFRLVAGVRSGCVNALANGAKINIPVYLAIGANDKIVCNKAIIKLADVIGSNATIKEYDAHHAIRKDSAKKEFFADVVDYLNKNIMN